MNCSESRLLYPGGSEDSPASRRCPVVLSRISDMSLLQPSEGKMRMPDDLHPPSNNHLHPGPKPTPVYPSIRAGAWTSHPTSHKHQVHTHSFTFWASAQPLLSTQSSVKMVKVPSKQLPGISQAICVTLPFPCTDRQEGLPAPSEAQGLQEQQALLLPDTPRGAGGLIYYCCALGRRNMLPKP